MGIEDRELIDLEMAKKTLSEKGFLDIKIISTSMEPLIKKNEIVQIKEVSKDLQKFDIIVFLRDRKFVAHYIWRVNGLSSKSYTTRSFENKEYDELPVQQSEVLGVVMEKKFSILKKIMMSLKYGS